jgi:DNA-binding transcriptional MerR regulator
VEDLYKIGAVAKRTGITPECLRAWERRYGLEPAERAGNTRFYSAGQVERLTTIKALLDQGHPISQVIHMPAEELERRLRPQRAARLDPATARVGLIGGPLVQAYRGAEDARLEAVGEWASIADLRLDGSRPGIDCAVVYVPSLDPQQVDLVREIFPGTTLVVLFKYATGPDLEHFEAQDVPLLRWPAAWPAVEALVSAAAPAVADGERRFTDEELLHIALMASRAGCECPADLVDLIGQLSAFAEHALRCQRADGSEQREHAAVAQWVGAARGQLENALAEQVDRYRLLETAN